MGTAEPLSEHGAPATIADLPLDMLLKVFTYLEFDELTQAVPLVCRRWNEALQLPSQVWEYLDVRLATLAPSAAADGVTLCNDPQKLSVYAAWLRRRGAGVRQLELASCSHGLAETLTPVGAGLRNLWFHIHDDRSNAQLQALLDLLPACSNLTTLNITGGTLHGCDFSSFRDLNHLSKLEFEERWSYGSQEGPPPVGEVPATFFGAAHLRELIHNMRGSGCHIGDDISCLQRLETLHIMQAGDLKLASRFSVLGALRELRFDDCTFDRTSRVTQAGTIQEWLPSSLTGLAALTRVDFHGARHMIHFPAGLCTLPALHTLNIGQPWGMFTASLPATFGRLTSLRHLQLSACGLTIVPPQIFLLPGLQSLRLLRNDITVLPSDFSCLVNLHALFIDTWAMRGPGASWASTYPLEVCKELASLQKLQSLHVRCGKLTASDPAALTRLAAIPALKDVSWLTEDEADSTVLLSQLAKALGPSLSSGSSGSKLFWNRIGCEANVVLSALSAVCGC